MLRATLFNIIRQECRQVENEIAEEERRPSPDRSRLTDLQKKEVSLRRELDSFPHP